MKKCEEDKQEECDQYAPKESKPGYVDLTCIFYRDEFLGRDGGDICDAPPKKKVKK